MADATHTPFFHDANKSKFLYRCDRRSRGNQLGYRRPPFEGVSHGKERDDGRKIGLRVDEGGRKSRSRTAQALDVGCTLVSGAAGDSARKRRAKSMSRGMMVTRFAWTAHRLVSSSKETRYASAAS